MVRARLAPTPSGYLHAGNAVNFAITAALCKAASGELRLRIDDLDADRARTEYVEDIFGELDWLGIAYGQGPKSLGEVADFGQRKKIPRYEEIIAQLVETGSTYLCTCSRAEILGRTGGLVYDGYCRTAGHEQNQPGALRLRISDEPILVEDVLRGQLQVDLSSASGDFMIRRRDGLPAYHVASLADDLDQGINLIVRGEDLLASTASQVLLARTLGHAAQDFLHCRFLHHGLVVKPDGSKLSKSQADSPLRELRRSGATPESVYLEAGRILRVAAAPDLAALTEALSSLASKLSLTTYT